MAAFIKTSKGFINIEQIDRISPPDEKDRICIGIAASEAGYWFEGEEGARIVKYFNLMALLDTTKRSEDDEGYEAPLIHPEETEFLHGEFDNGNHWTGSEGHLTS